MVSGWLQYSVQAHGGAKWTWYKSYSMATLSGQNEQTIRLLTPCRSTWFEKGGMYRNGARAGVRVYHTDIVPARSGPETSGTTSVSRGPLFCTKRMSRDDSDTLMFSASHRFKPPTLVSPGIEHSCVGALDCRSRRNQTSPVHDDILGAALALGMGFVVGLK